MTMSPVVVLGGGPDAERDISITSATAVHAAAIEGGLDSHLVIVDRPTEADASAWRDSIVIPVLHGPFGEGGELQHTLERAQVRFVGSRADASRRAMDKLGSKLEAARVGVPVTPASLLDPNDTEPPVELPAVIKPVADGSSYGLHICHDRPAWIAALNAVRADQLVNPHRAYMTEPFSPGRELTVAVLEDRPGTLRALPLVEIAPKDGIYDLAAKYTRTDTVYTVSPDLADDTTRAAQAHALSIANALGVRHLARVDFMLAEPGTPSDLTMLEINTMPGFTPTSLFPKAASATGLDLPALITHLVTLTATEPATT